MSGLIFYKPMGIQIAINLFISFFIFPQSCNYVAMSSMEQIVRPLHDAFDSVSTLLHASLQGTATFEDWIATGGTVRAKRTASQASGLAPALAAADYLSVDLSWGRFGEEEINDLISAQKDLTLRVGGSESRAPSGTDAQTDTFAAVAFFFDVVKSYLKHDLLDSAAFNVDSVRNGELSRHTADDLISTRPSSVYGGGDSDAPTPDHSPNTSQTDLPSMLVTRPTEREVLPPPPSSAVSFAGSISMDAQNPHQPLHPSPLHPLSHDVDVQPSSAKRAHFHLHPKHGRRRSSPFGSHLSLFDHFRKSQEPVGLFESHRCAPRRACRTLDLTRVFSHTGTCTSRHLRLKRPCSRSTISCSS